MKTVICTAKKIVFGNCQLSTVTLGDDVIDLSCDILLLYRLHSLSKSSKETFEILLLIRSFQLVENKQLPRNLSNKIAPHRSPMIMIHTDLCISPNAHRILLC